MRISGLFIRVRGTPNQRQEYSLVAHALKEAVNGEVVSSLLTLVGLLVGIQVVHALSGIRLYDFVWTYVQRDATVILRSLVRTKRNRPTLTRRIRVKAAGVH